MGTRVICSICAKKDILGVLVLVTGQESMLVMDTFNETRMSARQK